MSKLIKKEGLFYKECGAVMLPTKKASDIYITKYRGVMVQGEKMFYEEEYPNLLPQHLYITSDDEIKEGDKVLIFNNEGNIKIFSPQICSTVAKSMNLSNKDSDPTQHKYKKIIATTNRKIEQFEDVAGGFESRILFPQPSDKFIQAYIEAYNKSEKIEKVLVEYNEYEILGKPIGRKRYTLKLKDNKIIIKRVKDIWTRDEVYFYLSEFGNYLRDNYYGVGAPKLLPLTNGLSAGTVNEILDKWINENL